MPIIVETSIDQRLRWVKKLAERKVWIIDSKIERVIWNSYELRNK